MTKQTLQNKLLDSWINVSRIVDEYPECSLASEKLYSYLLYKSVLSRQKGVVYSEIIDDISQSTRLSISSVKKSLAWLRSKSLLRTNLQKVVETVQNTIIVPDTFGIYTDELLQTMSERDEYVNESIVTRGSLVYCLHITNGTIEFIKVGVAEDIHARIRAFRLAPEFKVRVVCSRVFEDKKNAFELERSLHNQLPCLGVNRFTPGKYSYSGKTECYESSEINIKTVTDAISHYETNT